MARMIAGHAMVDTPQGTACSACGKTWLAMLAEREHWKAGATGIAHSGALTDNEVAELRAELARVWDSLKAAVEA